MSAWIYLASRSPRRKALLGQIGIRFKVLDPDTGEASARVADVDETPLSGENPEQYVERLAILKADAGQQQIRLQNLPPQLVLGADTALELEGEIIGKPRDEQHACAILNLLSGKTHRVLTAVAVSSGNRVRCRVSVSAVRFRTLSEGDIRQYVATGEPLDKAGAYGIQGLAAIFIEEIRGSYSGIMGLPLFETAQLLAEFGYPLLLPEEGNSP